MNAVKRPTYLDFLNSLSGTTDDQLTNFSFSLKSSELKQYLFEKSPHGVYIHDYLNKSYKYVSPNVRQSSGHWAEAFLEGGTSFLLQIFHPDDWRTFNEEVFKAILAFLATKPVEEHKHYRFSFNYRLRRLDGSYNHLLQQGTFIRSNANGLPLYNFATITDISPYKTDSRIVLNIERVGENGSCQELFSYSYFPDPDEERLTKKELEVLKWMLEGLNSHEIADKLNTSFHTIRTHRKHMLEKTNAKNTADLIRYAIARGLLNS